MLLDDLAARREAKKRGLAVVGTLGILREAATQGYLDLRLAIGKLQQTSFYVAPELIEKLFDLSE